MRVISVAVVCHWHWLFCSASGSACPSCGATCNAWGACAGIQQTADRTCSLSFEHPHTVPVICKIQGSSATPAQADSGANRAITDDASLLHNRRQLEKPFPVGSIDAENKIYCTAIGELHLLTEERIVEQFSCFYCAQSAGTVISSDHHCTTTAHITKWEQKGDTNTGKGYICFLDCQDDIVATLPTYRRNGLWYNELNALPAGPTNFASIRALYAPEDSNTDYSSTLTDSDRHYNATNDIIIHTTDIANATATAPPTKKKSQPTLVETVNDEADEAELGNDNDEAEALDEISTIQETSPSAPTPYKDPHIAPPDEPPPNTTKRVRFQQAKLRFQQPTTPHIEDVKQKTPITKGKSKSYRPPKQTCRDWVGSAPPVPKQPTGNPPKPPPGNQLLTELWHHRMGHPGTQKLRNTQHHTTGMPPLGPLHPLFGCNNCNMAKMTKQARGREGTRAATINGKDFIWTMASSGVHDTFNVKSNESSAT
jgi:hypothetical protein